MKSQFDPQKNYQETLESIGFVPLKEATEKDWKRIGFKSGLEVHQQLKTKKKLFCHCPAGVFHDHEDYDGELIRHMRPTLSEMGEYDGTALMEFKTRKEIVYRINNQSACTYDIDDTPPFKINPEALEYALEVSLASNLNIVGEVHITRKQYLDGSIPTGFQRTAILGVEGEIELSNKKVKLIQLSIEEDSCREISDIGHVRVFKTDRLGMPLIETVTYPELETPFELREAAEHIRFLNRSTGKVRTGMGCGREDVNVSCKGGTRVEIKGVAHNKWIPRLSHIEAFRQWSLLNIMKILNQKWPENQEWDINSFEIYPVKVKTNYEPILKARKSRSKIWGVNLPGFNGILSHFTQPGLTFFSEIENRLKVIACIDKPNSVSSEDFDMDGLEDIFNYTREKLNAKDGDAQIIFWGPEEDISTALETIKERCQMAFSEIPRETRKPFSNGTTIFERVLPGADRMYPDTDSAPIPVTEEYIESLKKRMPVPIAERIRQMKAWKIPEDTFHYLLKKNLVPLIDRISSDLGFSQRYLGTFFGQTVKHIEGQKQLHPDFAYSLLYDLFAFIKENKLDAGIAAPMLEILMEHPNMDMNSILRSLRFKKRSREDLLAPVSFLVEKFKDIRYTNGVDVAVNWLMGQIRHQAVGNISLNEYSRLIRKQIEREYPDL